MAPLMFSVCRQSAVLVAPAGATPRELKLLSDIDDQESLRFHISNIQFYRYSPSMAGRDPAAVIREALARALVFYYPFAGRLRELGTRKLAVECTGEGVLFIEADADVRIEQFGDTLQPPFPCLEELLFNVPNSSAIVGAPLLLFQVTRLACGGFILTTRVNHAMADAQGLLQFLNAVTELARGLQAPTVLPVWERELLAARDPPRPTFAHREYDDVPDTKAAITPLDGMSLRSFFFGARQVAALRAHLPPHLRKNTTTFELLTSCLWKCRTVALVPDADEEMRIICDVTVRGDKSGMSLPRGYYGNAFAFSAAISTAGKLCKNPIGYAVELVKKAKGEVSAEYLRSVADLMVLRGRPHFTMVRAYVVSDVRRVGFNDLDFGWGKAVYGGPARTGAVVSFLIPSRNSKGEDGVAVPVLLPGPAMDRFVQEMDQLLRPALFAQQQLQASAASPTVRKSAL